VETADGGDVPNVAFLFLRRTNGCWVVYLVRVGAHREPPPVVIGEAPAPARPTAAAGGDSLR